LNGEVHVNVMTYTIISKNYQNIRKLFVTYMSYGKTVLINVYNLMGYDAV
jgi:hypothetical protein